VTEGVGIHSFLVMVDLGEIIQKVVALEGMRTL